MSIKGWIGVDFDGTLAHYEGWGDGSLGVPVPEMLFRVKKWLADGREVRIFTARIWPIAEFKHDQEPLIFSSRVAETPEVLRMVQAAEMALRVRNWCLEHIGQPLTVTCMKDYGMIELWDDRAVQVEPNTGRPIGKSTRGLE